MAESLKTRIKQIATHYGYSTRKFEEICQLGRGNISNMNEDGALGSDKLSKIIDTLPEVSCEWLLTGRGDMLRDEQQRQTQEPTIIYKSDPKDAAIIADKQLIIERDAELIASLRDKIRELEAKLSSKSVGLHSAPAVDTLSVGGNQPSRK